MKIKSVSGAGHNTLVTKNVLTGRCKTGLTQPRMATYAILPPLIRRRSSSHSLHVFMIAIVTFDVSGDNFVATVLIRADSSVLSAESDKRM